ncbi:hypothetical protein GCM10027046_39370 [Uliginosibacterium flavum]
MGNLVDLSIVDRNTGETLPIHVHQGQYWIAGTPGHRYGITLASGLYERSLTVVSVDGINAVSGETAAWDQTGYVLGERQNTQITGWRKSNTQVAAFVFTALPRSYAARTGRPQNVGSIGIATFRERAVPPPPVIMPYHSDESLSDKAASRASGAPAPAAEREKLGTGHGQREHSAVTFTDFERANPRPDDVVVIRYDSRDNLIALGIIPAPRPRAQPNPFPGNPGFVPDPPAHW